MLATACSYHTARIWDPITGACLHTLTEHTGLVFSVAFGTLPSGQTLLATGSSDDTARIWDIETETCLHTLTEHTDAVDSVAFTTLPTGQTLLATGSWDKTVRIWDPTTGTCLHTLTEHTDRIRCVAFTTLPTGQTLLATGSHDHTVRIWDPTTGTCLHTLTEHTDDVGSIAFTTLPTGQTLLAIANFERVVRICDVDTATFIQTLHHDVAVDLVTFGKDDNGQLMLATAGNNEGEGHDDVDYNAYLWAAGSIEQTPPEPAVPTTSTATDLSFMHTRSFAGHANYVTSTAFIQQEAGRLLLATGSSDNTARIWDASTGACLHTLTDHTLGSLHGMVASVAATTRLAGQCLLATGSWDSTARIWDATTGTCLHTLTANTRGVWSVAFATSPTGQTLLATGGSDSIARIWDATTGTCLQALPHPESIRGVSFGQDKSGQLLLATACDDHDAYLWTCNDRSDRPQRPATPDIASESNSHPPLATTELLALGAAGMWAPLGVVSDLISLTNPTCATRTPQPHDPRLRTIADHAGVRRLRELQWPAPARAAFAALLYAAQPVPNDYEPPKDSTPSERHQALTTAIGTTTGCTPGPVDLATLIGAAEAVGPQMITLLRIIGADASAVDPLLPLRLAHHANSLPELPQAATTLLSGSPIANQVQVPRLKGISSTHGAGTAGITRHGPPTTLLLTQLALPDLLLDLRQMTGELLHRYHPATIEPFVQPLTIVLDTTPRTYGPCEAVLRVLAHLLTTALWRRGRNPSLVTLTDPHIHRELTQHRDLMDIWTSRTLEPPDLVTALRTATSHTRNAVVTLTIDVAVDEHPVPSAASQLVTTHYPGHPPSRQTSRPFHHHLGPDLGPGIVARTIRSLLESQSRR